MSGTLVVQTAFLGDVILTTGLLTELAARFGPVDVVTTPAGRHLLEAHPAVRRAIAFDKRGGDRGAGGVVRLAGRLRVERYDRAFLPHRSLRSGVLALLARIPERTGFAGSPGQWCYTRRVRRPVTGHEAERLLALAEPREGACAALSLGLTGADRAEAGAWLDARGLVGPFVAVAPGSIWATKRWPGYPALAAALEHPIVVIGGPEDASLAEAVAGAAGARGHVAAGALSLRVAAAVIERAALLVTNDSAPLHLASAVGTPVVAVFGPTVPALGFGPRGAGDQLVELEGLPCRPCSSHGPQVCPLGHHRCMGDLGVERVVAAVEVLDAERLRRSH